VMCRSTDRRDRSSSHFARQHQIRKQRQIQYPERTAAASAHLLRIALFLYIATNRGNSFSLLRPQCPQFRRGFLVAYSLKGKAMFPVMLTLLALIGIIHCTDAFSVVSGLSKWPIKAVNVPYLRSQPDTTSALAASALEASENHPSLMTTLTGKTSQRVFSWSLLAAFVVGLRSFFSIIVGTFFLSYMGHSATSSLQKGYSAVCTRLHVPKRMHQLPRRVFVTLYVAFCATVVTRFATTISPRIVTDWVRTLTPTLALTLTLILTPPLPNPNPYPNPNPNPNPKLRISR